MPRFAGAKAALRDKPDWRRELARLCRSEGGGKEWSKFFPLSIRNLFAEGVVAFVHKRTEKKQKQMIQKCQKINNFKEKIQKIVMKLLLDTFALR